MGAARDRYLQACVGYGSQQPRSGCRANLLLSPGSRVAVGWEHRCLCLLFKNKGKKAFMHQSGN